jgi:hypothetical protein
MNTETLIKKTAPESKCAQNRTKLMAAIVLLLIAGLLLPRMYRQQKSAPMAVLERPTEVPSGVVHFPGTGQPSEPPWIQQKACHFFVSAGARPDTAA